MSPHNLRNNYFLMRHGRSEANEKGLIVSTIANGASSYGLTDEGRNQVRTSILGQSQLKEDTVIVASDFLRARETAALAAELLHTAGPATSELLRERNFGIFELKSDGSYPLVWEEDRKRANTTGAESPQEVQNRFRRFIAEMEESYSGKNILAVSHGDSLQIALTWGAGIPPEEHRSLRHMNTAEIRSFPDPRR